MFYLSNNRVGFLVSEEQVCCYNVALEGAMGGVVE